LNRCNDLLNRCNDLLNCYNVWPVTRPVPDPTRVPEYPRTRVPVTGTGMRRVGYDFEKKNVYPCPPYPSTRRTRARPTRRGCTRPVLAVPARQITTPSDLTVPGGFAFWVCLDGTRIVVVVLRMRIVTVQSNANLLFQNSENNYCSAIKSGRWNNCCSSQLSIAIPNKQSKQHSYYSE
jgi:hypothetical protein